MKKCPFTKTCKFEACWGSPFGGIPFVPSMRRDPLMCTEFFRRKLVGKIRYLKRYYGHMASAHWAQEEIRGLENSLELLADLRKKR